MLKCIGLFISCCIFSVCYAEAPNQQLEAVLSYVKTMQATFTQQLKNNKDQILQKSAGKMILKRPGCFFWKITSPTTQTIVINGDRVWIYDKDLQQVTIRSLSKTGGTVPAQMLSGDVSKISMQYHVHVSQKNDHKVFVLTPKSNSSIMKKIEINISKQQIEGMWLYDHLGHVTKITFMDIMLNNTVSDQFCHFVVPSGVDVINES